MSSRYEPISSDEINEKNIQSPLYFQREKLELTF